APVTANGLRFEAAPTQVVPPRRDCALAAGDLTEQIKSDVMLNQHVTAIFRKLGVFDLEQLKTENAALRSQRLAHGGTAELVDLRGQKRGPTWFAVARFFD